MVPAQLPSVIEPRSLRPEQQLIYLLSLLGEHGTRLSYAHRAQHLQVARALLISLHAEVYGRLSNYILLALSRFLAACEKESGADNEHVLEALFSLTTATCACESGDKIYDLARDSGTSLPELFSTVGGLFPLNREPVVIDGAVLPDNFIVSHLKFNEARNAFRRPQETHACAAVAHIVFVACEIAVTNNVLRLRVAALGSIAALVRVLHPAQVAAFFPGIASKLSKALARSRLDQSVLSVLAIDALSVAVTSVFPKAKTYRAAESSFTSLIRAVLEKENPHNEKRDGVNKAKNEERDTNVGPVDRTDGWYSGASTNFSRLLRIVLESTDGPRWHENQRVRTALAVLVDTCVFRHSKLLLEPVVRAQCFITIVETAADPCDDPRDMAQELIERNLTAEDGCLLDIESGLQALFSYVLRLDDARSFGFECPDDDMDNAPEDEALQHMLKVHDDEPRWMRVLKGYIRVLSEKYSNNVLFRVGCDRFAQVIVAFQKAIYKPYAVDSPTQYDLLRNTATDSFWRLGKAGLLPALLGSLIGIAERQTDGVSGEEMKQYNEPDAFVNHTLIVQCMNAMFSGAADAFRKKYIDMRTAEEKTDWAQLKRHAVEALECAAGCSLPLDEDVYRRQGWAHGATLRAKQGALMCSAQILDTLAELKNKHRPVGFEVVMPTILAFLVDAAREENEVNVAAEHALSSLSRAVGYKDQRELERRHVNFVVARLVRNLHQKWAAAVLRYVVGERHDHLCARVVELASSTLIAQCDALAGASDERASTTLAALGAVLSTALGTANVVGKSSHVRNRRPTGSEQWEIDELTKVLMSYCTDEVRAEDDVVSIDDEWPRMPDDIPDNEERKKSPFEEIAVAALAAVADLLVGRPAMLRAQALQVAATGIEILAEDERSLLPCAATLLPLIPAQLGENTRTLSDDRNIVGVVNKRGLELPVVAAACALIAALVRTARGFVQGRFVRLIYPRLRPLLQLVRVGAHSDASFAALAAADAALHCVAAVATELPDVLRPFANELTKVAIPYLGKEKEKRTKAIRSAGNEARRRYELRRFERRARWADELLAGLTEVAPDEVWALLVVESAPEDEITYGDDGMKNLRVR